VLRWLRDCPEKLTIRVMKWCLKSSNSFEECIFLVHKDQKEIFEENLPYRKN
jgi:hypothetical protein